MISASHIRPAAVAGMFYPGDAATLSADIAAMLSEAAPSALRPKALIVPHAGYVYSGPVAASAYALLRPLRGAIRRVVLLGPAHRVAVRGLAVPRADTFVTPLGSIAIDAEALRMALCLPQVLQSDAPHAQEHSLEVQLPFLQTVLGEFSLAPFVVGLAAAADVAAVIDALWDGDDCLIVVSSDLSHYHPYREAQRLDRVSVDRIVDLTPLADHEQACGATPINGLIEVARRRRLAAHLLDLRNSGDTAGDKTRVVGYAAVAFTEADAGHGH
jgi:AmmeMemoRadiSam system protein B